MKNSTWFLFVVGFLHITQACDSDLIVNGDFELNVNNWFCKGSCNLAPSTDAYQGSGSALVTGRNQPWEGPAQDVAITSGYRYSFTGYVKFLDLAQGTLYDSVELVMKCYDSNNNDAGVWTWFGKVERVRAGRWTKVGGFRYIRPGLHTCQVYVKIGSPGVNYVIDSMSLVQVPELTTWRQEAIARINKIRKSTMKVQMVRSVPGNYTIEIQQTKHLFGFGSAVGAEQIVDTDPAYKNYQDVFFKHFEWAVLENALKWRIMEWNKVGRWIKLRGHNVFWGVEKSVPSWVKDLNITELKAEMAKRITGVVNFTKERIEHWDVNNENLHGDWFEQALNNSEVMSQMFKDVNAIDGDVKLFLNDFGVLQNNMAMGVRNQALYLKETGVPVHGMGIQSHLTPNNVDMTLFKHRLDTVAEVNLPIWITELTVDEANATLKAQVLADVMTMYFSHPAVSGILLWGFWDGKISKPNAALFEGQELTPNDAGMAYLNLMQKWRTRDTLVLSENGSANVRGFKGDYSVVVKRDGEVRKRLSFTMHENMRLRIKVRR